MSFGRLNSGIRKSQEFFFNWDVPNFEISKRYTNKVEIGKNVIKVLMEPYFENGEIMGSNPFILFDSIEESEKRAKEFRFSVSTHLKEVFCVSTIRFRKFKLHQRYAADQFFLRPHSLDRYLGPMRTLSLRFNIFIMGIGYEVQATFNNSKYSLDFQNFYKNKAFCDCEFIVDGKTIGANKIILIAQSKSLAEAMEKSGNKLPIDNCSFEIFSEFLEFVYTGKLVNKKENVLIGVLSLGHQYNMNSLKKYCENIFLNNLRSSNANEIFQAAHKYELSDDLKKAAFLLIQKIFKEINQKLSDEFINDPAYVENLITIAETLKNGLKRKEPFKTDVASLCITQSSKQLNIETAIDNICKEAEESLKNISIELIVEEIEEETVAKENVEIFVNDDNYTLNHIDDMEVTSIFHGDKESDIVIENEEFMNEFLNDVDYSYDEHDFDDITEFDVLSDVKNETFEKKIESFPLAFEVIMEESDEDAESDFEIQDKTIEGSVNFGASTSSDNPLTKCTESNANVDDKSQNFIESIQKSLEELSMDIDNICTGLDDFEEAPKNAVEAGSVDQPDIIKEEKLYEIVALPDIITDEMKKGEVKTDCSQNTEQIDKEDGVKLDEDLPKFDFKEEVFIADIVDHK